MGDKQPGSFEKIPHDPEPPKLSRRFSLSGLLSRRKKHHQHHPSTIATGLPTRANSLTYLPTGDVAATSEINQAPPSLHRSKSLASVVQRIFRKKSGRELTTHRAPYLVSSLYLQSAQGAQSNLQLPSGSSLGGDGGNESREALASVSSRDHLQTIHEEFQRPNEPLHTTLRVLTTSRCVLEESGRPIQGVMVITTKKITFSSPIGRPPYRIILEYGDIVAVVPAGDRSGIKIATRITCLRFAAFPEREEVLKILIEEWLLHCRHNLMTSHHSQLHDRPGVPCLWLRKSLSTIGASGTADSSLSLRRAKSVSFRSRYLEKLPEPPIIRPCHCQSHYRNEILEMTMRATPSAVAGILFGLSGSGIAYAGTYFSAHGGNTIEESKWTIEGESRKRHVIANVPDAFRPTTMMRIEFTLKVLLETADIVVVDARVGLRQTSFGNNYQYLIRWCIFRQSPLIKYRCMVNLSAEVRVVGPAPLPLQTVEERMIAFLKENFVAMLETLRVRLEVADKQQSHPNNKLLRGTSLEVVVREFFFLIYHQTQEAWRDFKDELREIRLTRQIISIFVVALVVSIAVWLKFRNSSSYSGPLAIPIKFKNILPISHQFNHKLRESKIQNVTDIAQFIKERIR